MMKVKTALCCFLLPLLARGFTVEPSSSVTVRRTQNHHELSMIFQDDENNASTISMRRRRQLIIGSLVGGATALIGGADSALAVERAVGAYEKACREAGNCLERGDWDAAVGWSWGGKDRCDATDPKCGPNGVLLDEVPQGEAVPAATEKFTCVVAITLAIGRGESGTLSFGLYGDATPQSVQQLVDFLSPAGLKTASRNFGALTEPVSLETGGILTGISPGQRVQFGIPSQGAAYARSMGLSKAGDSFEPMPRPREQLNSETSVRPHDCAGLISIPGSGLGYANPNGPEDEAYANAFQITASAVPGMDKEGRKVIGQLTDTESMAFLERVANLPTNKGLKGIIPGQDFGPPLLKTVVTDVKIKKLGGFEETPAS